MLQSTQCLPFTICLSIHILSTLELSIPKYDIPSPFSLHQFTACKGSARRPIPNASWMQVAALKARQQWLRRLVALRISPQSGEYHWQSCSRHRWMRNVWICRSRVDNTCTTYRRWCVHQTIYHRRISRSRTIYGPELQLHQTNQRGKSEMPLHIVNYIPSSFFQDTQTWPLTAVKKFNEKLEEARRRAIEYLPSWWSESKWATSPALKKETVKKERPLKSRSSPLGWISAQRTRPLYWAYVLWRARRRLLKQLNGLHLIRYHCTHLDTDKY